MKAFNFNLVYIGLLSTIGFSLSASLALQDHPQDLSSQQRWPAAVTTTSASPAPGDSDERVRVTVDGKRIDAVKEENGKYTAYIPDPTCHNASCPLLPELIATQATGAELQKFLQNAIEKIVADRKAKIDNKKDAKSIRTDCDRDDLLCRTEALKDEAAACEQSDSKHIADACKQVKNKERCESQQEKSQKRACHQRVTRYFNSQVLRLMRTQLSLDVETEEFNEAELIRDELLADLPESFVTIREGLIDASKTGVAARTQKNYADLIANGESAANASFQAKLQLQEELSISPFSTAGRLKGAIDNYAHIAEDRRLVGRVQQSYQRSFYQPLIQIWMRDLSKLNEDSKTNSTRLGLDLSADNLARAAADKEKERGQTINLPAAFGSANGRAGTLGTGASSTVAPRSQGPINRSNRGAGR